MFSDIFDGSKVGGFLSLFKLSSLFWVVIICFLIVDYQH